MKNGYVMKNAAAKADELALVNMYARKELKEDEVYLFSTALCDNEIDRDFERFGVDTLYELEKLFVGKTGIVDHDPKAMNQKARIISCMVERVEGRKTSLGDDYYRLTARAYIPKNEHTAELTGAIDAGIVKEVSVGCAVDRTVCSVCGNEMHSPLCSHIKGRRYNGELCFGILEKARDAYEFSFVAVPAQKDAGVIKALKKEKTMKELLKAIGEKDELTLTKPELTKLSDYLTELQSSSRDAALYRGELERETLSAISKRLDMPTKNISKMLSKLSCEEVRELRDAMKKAQETPRPQLAYSGGDSGDLKNTQFRI